MTPVSVKRKAALARAGRRDVVAPDAVRNLRSAPHWSIRCLRPVPSEAMFGGIDLAPSFTGYPVARRSSSSPRTQSLLIMPRTTDHGTFLLLPSAVNAWISSALPPCNRLFTPRVRHDERSCILDNVSADTTRFRVSLLHDSLNPKRFTRAWRLRVMNPVGGASPDT